MDSPVPTLKEAVGPVERDHIDNVLKMFKGNIWVAAKTLGLSRPGLYAKIRHHSLDLNSYRQQADDAQGA